MPMKPVRFQDQVRRCSAELRVLLPGLADRHTPLVVLAALSEHVGGALFLFQESGVCNQRRVGAMIRRVERLTFAESPRPPSHH